MANIVQVSLQILTKYRLHHSFGHTWVLGTLNDVKTLSIITVKYCWAVVEESSVRFHTQDRDCLLLRSTSCGRWLVRPRRTPVCWSTSAGRWSERPGWSHRSTPSTSSQGGSGPKHTWCHCGTVAGHLVKVIESEWRLPEFSSRLPPDHRSRFVCVHR